MTLPTSQSAALPIRFARVSVVRAWTSVDDAGVMRAQTSPDDYVLLLGDAMNAWGRGTTPAGPGSMPWTSTPNNFWKYQYGSDYQNRNRIDLARTLLPLHVTSPAGEASCPPGMTFESFWHPFGWTTAIHASVPEQQPRASEDAFRVALDRLLRTQIAPGRRLLDGAPAEWLADSAGLAAGTPVILVSGLRDAAVDPLPVAQRLAERYDSATVATPFLLSRTGSAMCVKGRTVAMTMPAPPDEKSGVKFQCFHHNVSTLLMLTEALLGTLGDGLPAAGDDWYRYQAAAVLTHLYAGEALPGRPGTVYKSRLTQQWIDELAVADAIDAAAVLSEIPPKATIRPSASTEL